MIGTRLSHQPLPWWAGTYYHDKLGRSYYTVLGVNWLVAWAAMVALALRNPGIVIALARNESHPRRIGLNQRVLALEKTNAELRRRVTRLQTELDIRTKQLQTTETALIPNPLTGYHFH